jgi:hypothetical protein
VSPIVDSLSVCLGAISAVRSLASVQESFRSQFPLSASPRSEPWQHTALSLASGATTILYALAGGTRHALMTSAAILAAGAAFVLLVQTHLRGARR